jgi:hypothetical protein
MNARIDRVQELVRRDLIDLTQRNASLAIALRRVHERAKTVPLDIDPLHLTPVFAESAKRNVRPAGSV